MDHANDYGARLERGRVTERQDNACRVESYDRSGITTPPLPLRDGLQAEVGDKVLFFLFDDGTGVVIARMEAQHVAANA